MPTKQSGLVFAAAGLILMIVSFLADEIGVGQSDGFGLRQMVGAILGIIILALGVRLWKRKSAVNAGQASSSEEEGLISRVEEEGG